VSVLSDIRGAIVDLLEGSTGDSRTIASEKFSVVSSDHEVLQARCVADPRPVYLEDGGDWEDPSLPTDVAGDYYYRGRRIVAYIAYGFNPDDDTIDRDQTIDDDETTAVRCLTWPNNWALTTGWCGCEVEASRDEARDQDGVVAIQFLVLTLLVSYREDFS